MLTCNKPFSIQFNSIQFQKTFYKRKKFQTTSLPGKKEIAFNFFPSTPVSLMLAPNLSRAFLLALLYIYKLLFHDS